MLGVHTPRLVETGSLQGLRLKSAVTGWTSTAVTLVFRECPCPCGALRIDCPVPCSTRILWLLQGQALLPSPGGGALKQGVLGGVQVGEDLTGLGCEIKAPAPGKQKKENERSRSAV